MGSTTNIRIVYIVTINKLIRVLKMAATYDSVRSIGPIRPGGNYKIKVRVVRLWSLRPYGKDPNPDTEGSLEMVLCDREV